MHRLVTCAVALVVLAGCSGSDPETQTTGPERTTATARTPRTPRTTSTSTTTSTTTTVAAPGSSRPAPVPTTPQPTAESVPPVAAGVDPARLYASWRPGCPVGPESLRLLQVDFLGLDGAVHTGEIVVHADVADNVQSVFATLLAANYPIERMELVDVYGGNDDASTMANNTSGFNCREITGGGRWSEHSYGRAIDINPVQNPYVYRDGHVLDPAAARYTDRSLQEPGMIHTGDAVVSAFASIGWGWGGNFSSIKDYQHFSASGG